MSQVERSRHSLICYVVPHFAVVCCAVVRSSGAPFALPIALRVYTYVRLRLCLSSGASIEGNVTGGDPQPALCCAHLDVVPLPRQRRRADGLLVGLLCSHCHRDGLWSWLHLQFANVFLRSCRSGSERRGDEGLRSCVCLRVSRCCRISRTAFLVLASVP